MTFSEKLYFLRTKEGLSQEGLADALGVSRQSISKWELGDSMPEIGKIIEISEHFNVTIDSLIKDDQTLNCDNTLEKLVVQFLNSAKNMNQISDDLIEIAKDGVIDNDEKVQLEEILGTLDSVSQLITELRKMIDMSD